MSTLYTSSHKRASSDCTIDASTSHPDTTQVYSPGACASQEETSSKRARGEDRPLAASLPLSAQEGSGELDELDEQACAMQYLLYVCNMRDRMQ